jgi:hypothetical protein
LNGQPIDRQAIEQESEILANTEPVSEIQAIDEVNTTSFQNELRDEEQEETLVDQSMGGSPSAKQMLDESMQSAA